MQRWVLQPTRRRHNRMGVSYHPITNTKPGLSRVLLQLVGVGPFVDGRHPCGWAVRITLPAMDVPLTTPCPRPHVPQLFLSDEVIMGEVEITPPHKHRVYHYGIQARLESIISECWLVQRVPTCAGAPQPPPPSPPRRVLLCCATAYFQSEKSRPLLDMDVQVCPPGYIS